MKRIYFLFVLICITVCAAVAAAFSGCSSCSGNKPVDEPVEHEHNYEKEVVIGDCETGGYVIYTCKTCGDSYRETDKSATGEHDYEIIPEVKATCTMQGYTEHKKCRKCGHVEGKEILYGPASGHFYEDVPKKDPTCSDVGYTAYKECSKCGDEVGKTELPTVEHQADKEHGTVTPLECGVQSESIEYPCIFKEAGCDTILTETTKDINDPEYSSHSAFTDKPMKGYEDQYHIPTCSKCGNTYTEDQKKEHEFKMGTSYNEKGHSEVCKICKHEKSVAHNFEKMHNEEQHWEICACGYSTEKTGHIFNEDKCTVCDYKRSMSTDLFSFSFNDSLKTAELNGIKNADAFIDELEKQSKVLYLPKTVSYNGSEYKITKIGNGAFKDNEYITQIHLYSNITSIGASAFEDCTQLSTVYISDSLESIGDNAFKGCNGIGGVDYKSAKTVSPLIKWCGITFDNAYSNPMYANSKRVDLSFDSVPQSNLTVPAETTVNNYAFAGCNLTKVEFVSNKQITRSIGIGAFMGCTNLAEVKIGEGIINIGESAFSNCEITRLELPLTLTEIGLSAFSYENSAGTYSGISNVYYGDTFNAENWCGITFGNKDSNPMHGGNASINGMTAVEILSDKFTQINKNTFCGFPITKLVAPNVNTVGDNAFMGCTLIKNITLPKVKTISAGAFSGCTLIENITLSEVGTIGEGAFMDCLAITNLSLPATTIGKDAFKGCKKITNISLLAAETIGENAFYGCNGITNLKIPFAGLEGMIDNSSDFKLSNLELLEVVSGVFAPAKLSGILPVSTKIILGAGEDFNLDVSGSITVGGNIYYRGSQDEWKGLMGSDNIKNDVYFYSTDEPQVKGNYWHEVDGEVVVWSKSSDK